MKDYDVHFKVTFHGYLTKEAETPADAVRAVMRTRVRDLVPYTSPREIEVLEVVGATNVMAVESGLEPHELSRECDEDEDKEVIE